MNMNGGILVYNHFKVKLANAASSQLKLYDRIIWWIKVCRNCSEISLTIKNDGECKV